MSQPPIHAAKAAKHTESGPARAGHAAPTAPEAATAPHYAAILDLQRAIGNRRVARLFEPPAEPGESGGKGAPLRRQANATMPPPNQSVAPARPKQFNNGIRYQGEVVFPESASCKAILKKMLPEKGFETTSSFGHSFAKAASETKVGWALFADSEYISLTQASMLSAVTEFDEECRIFLEVFETVAGNMTDQLLTNAEEQIIAEQQKLGMKETVHATEIGSFTSYSASNTGAMNDMKAAAGALAVKREKVDALGNKSRIAREKVDAESSKVLEPSKDGQATAVDTTKPPQPMGVATSPVGGLPAFVPQGLIDAQETTYKEWQEAEEEFRKEQHATVGKHPGLGPLMTGTHGTAQRLKAFASETPAKSGQRLGEDFAEKLKNIRSVREELGGRFSVWKQPAIVSMTHQRQKSGPGEERLVRDKIRKIQADEKSTKEMYAAIALGLGLLAAIPTGGSSLMAGVAVAASVSGAALSAYSAYESAQDYLLQKASANTSLDRAYQISESEPSMLYLAIDIASAISDLRGAKVAFETLRTTIAAAKAAKNLEKLPDVVVALRRANISATNQGRVLNEVLPAGGDIGKALHDIRQVFIRTAKDAADKETAKLMQTVAERALDRGKVIVVPNNKAEALDVLRLRLADRGIKNVDEVVNKRLRDFFGGGGNTAGLYDVQLKLVFIKGNTSAEGAAAVLVHELTHRGQHAQKALSSARLYQAEFEAFKAEQQFLQMLPLDRVPAQYDWLLRAKDGDIEKHILTAYADKIPVKPLGVDHDSIAEGIFNTLFQSGSW